MHAVRISNAAEGFDAAVRISDAAEGFDAVGVYSLVATSSTIYESMKILNECWNLKICFYFKQFCRNQLKEGRKARRNNLSSEPHSPYFHVRATLESSSFGFYVF